MTDDLTVDNKQEITQEKEEENSATSNDIATEAIENVEENTENATEDVESTEEKSPPEDSSSKEDGQPVEEQAAWMKKRLARQEKKHAKELENLKQQMEFKKQQELKTLEEKLSPEIAAEVAQKLEEQQVEQQITQAKVNELAKQQRFVQNLNESKQKYEDFEESVTGAEFTANFTEPMLLASQNSPNAGELLYYLSKNPKETARISRLPVEQQVREMYMVEASILNRTKPIKSSAPPPIAKTKATPKSNISDPTKMDFNQLVEEQRRKLQEKYRA
jgi:hypothetical protein